MSYSEIASVLMLNMSMMLVLAHKLRTPLVTRVFLSLGSSSFSIMAGIFACFSSPAMGLTLVAWNIVLLGFSLVGVFIACNVEPGQRKIQQIHPVPVSLVEVVVSP